MRLARWLCQDIGVPAAVKPALGGVPFVPAPGDTPAIGKILKKVLALRSFVRIINFVA